ncbi:alpha/beta hydrolase [Kordiimonas sp. SCSIO 12603]|uniref:alpha/beta hydrolase family protein n=1 Tax=Kordiimonas sp. SCSIO 12603 TaxID=2829596 RepID=UPI002102FB22|nr:alpha/beta hydrolase [Kordiimonas sp. SCSIO 12603]UTW60302.1 alpha/beta hydrolase [Kordiimonas sp. SCSIO 12603]
MMKKLLLAAVMLFFSAPIYADDYLIEEITFPSHDIQLSGSLVLPTDKPIKAAVVFVHGSGKQTRSLHWAKRFADTGIAALVYDKRGAGKSGGFYESNQSVSGPNIALLADDAAAALKAVQAHPKTNTAPTGLTGISQAGWIVPIAAEKAGDVDFMVLWSGPVCKVSEEDIYSKYTRDLDSKRVPSYAEALNARTSEYIWPDFLGTDSNPSDNLAHLNIPGLWVFGEQDGSVPIDLSVSRLKKLIHTGKPYEYALFSNLGHNNMTETFNTVTDWIIRKTQ